MVSSFAIEDIDAINALGKELNDNFSKLFHIANLNPNEKIYVYKKGNILLGFIHISIIDDFVDILNIIVKKNNRNEGIASLLMDYMITDLRQNIKKIMLEVDENNNSAIKFYQKFNFEIINIRKNYYKDHNALIMERILR